MFEIEQEQLQDFARSSRMEWLETNGLGGWSGSSVSGAHTRRYHGMLVVATKPPTQRMVLLSRLDETVCVGPLRFDLGCNQFPGAVHPIGYQYLERFVWDGFPTFEFKVGEIVLRKKVIAVHGENTVAITYEVVKAPEPFVLELQPLVAARDYHALVSANEHINRKAAFKNGIFSVRPYDESPDLKISVPGARYTAQPQWYYKFEYLREFERGQNYREDLFSYGKFSIKLAQGLSLGVIASTGAVAERSAFDLLGAEVDRRKALIAHIPEKESFRRQLHLAADNFIVERGADWRTIIAGYPWFTDWGRDTMISLPGLCIATGRLSDAKKIFEAFCEYVSEGMIPNCFPDGDGPPGYNTVDATLWFFVAVYHYLKAGGDEKFVREIVYPRLVEIVDRHLAGTRFGIGVDPKDGLLAAGNADTQLTWMDVHSGGYAVTPRHGKAVEINALWYNALLITAELAELYADSDRCKNLSALAKQTKSSFTKCFWNEARQCLYDFVNGDGANADVRPNQIIALALPFELVPPAKAKKIVQVVEERLLTPFGLRTLEPGNPQYCGRYEGTMQARDRAYHQGTVWPWLFGSYACAVRRYGTQQQRAGVKAVLESFEKHLRHDGLNSIAEVFDGDAPQRPAGCPYQAWSVAEVLRSLVEADE